MVSFLISRHVHVSRQRITGHNDICSSLINDTFDYSVVNITSC